jgi:hypothetical protein
MEIGGSLSATYNENGKLISVIEKYKDVKLPLLLFILYTIPRLANWYCIEETTIQKWKTSVN